MPANLSCVVMPVITVKTTNATVLVHDLCRVAVRELRKLGTASGAIDVAIDLTDVTRVSRDVGCRLEVAVRSGGQPLGGPVKGSARVPFDGPAWQLAAKDCVDAVIEDLVARRIVPLLTSTPPPNAAPTVLPAPPTPAPAPAGTSIPSPSPTTKP
jgi:hypothetical protein